MVDHRYVVIALALVGAACFLLAAFRVAVGVVELIPLGLLCLALIFVFCRHHAAP